MTLYKAFLPISIGALFICETMLAANGSEQMRTSLLSDTETRRLQFTGEKEPVIETKAPPIIYVIKQSLPEFLKQAARRDGYQIAISSKIEGVLTKISLPMGIEKILEEIAPQFDLQWHFHNQKVHVALAKETIWQSVELGAMSVKGLELAMKNARLHSDDYKLLYAAESNTIFINGTQDYIASVEQIVRSFWKNK